MNNGIECIIYYGMSVPDPEKTRALRNSYVVLQDYHPLNQLGLYKDFFPNSKRFLYWNPAKVWMGGEFNAELEQLPSIDYSELWKTKTLDLGDPASFHFSLHTASNLLQNKDVDGLFVDDVDFFCSSRSNQELILSLLSTLEEQHNQRPLKYFFNRGMPLWNKVSGLDAVLLEGLYGKFPLMASSHENEWIKYNLLSHLRLLKAIYPKLPVIGLRYDSENQKEGRLPNPALSMELSSYFCAEIQATRNLDQWPGGLQ